MAVAKIAVAAIRVLYFPMKVLAPRNKITMLSRQSDDITLDFLLLKKAIQEENPDLKVVVLTKKLEGNIFNKIGYGFHMLKQMYNIATSKIVVVDGYCIPVSVLNHRGKRYIIQTWHAVSAIKNFGYRALDKEDGVSSKMAQAMCMHRNYDFVTACGELVGDIYAESFNTPRDRVKILGLPRMDYIRVKHENKIKAIYEKYPQLATKENILYAPTFRKGRKVSMTEIMDAVDLDKYNLIVKLHPVDRLGFENPGDDRVICDELFQSYDWLWVCSKVITDYSGIGIESTLLEKELYFYLYDYESYKNSTGVIVDLYKEAVGKYVTDDPLKLKELLKEDYDMETVRNYRDKYIEADISDCSGSMAKWIIGLLNIEENK